MSKYEEWWVIFRWYNKAYPLFLTATTPLRAPVTYLCFLGDVLMGCLFKQGLLEQQFGVSFLQPPARCWVSRRHSSCFTEGLLLSPIELLQPFVLLFSSLLLSLFLFILLPLPFLLLSNNVLSYFIRVIVALFGNNRGIFVSCYFVGFSFYWAMTSGNLY